MLTLAQAIQRWAEAHAEQEARARSVRAWNAGACIRRNWYGEHGYEPLPTDGRMALVRDLGQRIEDSVVAIAAVATALEDAPGFRRATFAADSRELEAIGTVVPDFYIAGDPYGYPGEELWGDVKSVAPYRYEQLAAGEPVEHEHAAQGECYCRATPSPAGILLYYDKATSAILERVHVSSDETWARVLADAAGARGEVLPARPYDLTCQGCAGTGRTQHHPPRAHAPCGGTGKVDHLQYPCSYCPYRADCWGWLEEVEDGGKVRLRPVEVTR